MIQLREIMNLDVPTTSPDKTLKELLDVFVEEDLKSIVVVDKEKKPIGILTEDDWIKKVLHKNIDINNTKVKDVMTTPVITVDPTLDLDDAINIMYSNNLRRLVIVDNDELIGIVETTDIINRAKSLAQQNKKLLMYQTIQTYIIFTFFVGLILYLIIKYLI